MEAALEMARAKDTKERMAGVEHLYHLLEASTRSLSAAEVTSLVDCCLDILKDNSNFRVSQGALQSLASAAVLSGDHFKLHFNALVPSVVERLGDSKQPVRDAARRLLLTLMEVSSPTIIVERAGSYAWMHKSWRVREEFARTVTSAIGLFATTELPLQRVLLPPVLQLLNDSNQAVREAAILCIEEMYMQVGLQFHDELQRHHLPTSLAKEISSRLEHIEPKSISVDGKGGHLAPIETKPNNLPAYNPKRSSPKAKSTPRESSLFGGESDIPEKPVDPIKVYSDKELVREIEKVAAALVPEKDWSVRIAAMQRVEGLVFGGAVDYPSFLTLLKQLVPPLFTQLSDRRSSIVKQACHLLNLLSKELLGDFEACAEMFIPVLFKLVVITVLVIAESADNCIKTMLRNCKVSRVLPRIADCARNDRSAVLRARCCEYALLILEYWADAPEIHRSADLYEDLIKCCVADAMSEVRSTARTCYRMFTKTWPERSRRLYSSFDPAVQRLINDEDGGLHRRYASPSLRERGQSPRTQAQTLSADLQGFGTSAIVAMDRSAGLSSGMSLSSSSMLLSQTKLLEKGAERSLESVLHSSKEKVTAIESMLRGLDMPERFVSVSCSTGLDLGVDAPTSRDPPFPPAVHASDQLNLHNLDLVAPVATKSPKDSAHNDSSIFSDLITTQIQPSKDSERASYFNNLKTDLSSNMTRRSSIRPLEGSSAEENTDHRLIRRFPNVQIDKQFTETPYRDSSSRDPHGSYIPNFQRPLLRKQATGRTSAGSRHSFDDSQLSFGDMPSYIDGPASLGEALTEGLSPSSDWCARVAAFNYLRTLLQQGPKGIQEVTQSFEKVMKLFFQHLDDPHYKVAQAALTTLTEIIQTCRKPFESHLERTLPRVFSRLIDQKEVVRQPCSTALEIVGKAYGIDSLLPAFLRSLGEQRSPKAKLAVIEFAINSFNKHSMNSEGHGNSGFLKLWFAKLAPLTHDKNIKLKEAAITCIISAYSHYDSASVLNFILSLSVEEQNSLRRALKQYTPRIEVDLMNYFQNRKERQQRPKILYDQSDLAGSIPDDGFVGTSKKGHHFGRYSGGSIGSDSGRKITSMVESMQIGDSADHAISDDIHEHLYQNFDDVSSHYSRGKDLNDISNYLADNGSFRANHSQDLDRCTDFEASATPRLDVNRLINFDTKEGIGLRAGSERLPTPDINQDKLATTSKSTLESCSSIPQLLHKICNGNVENSVASKQGALQLLVETSIANDPSVWTKYFNQILTSILEVLDDADSSVRELALSLIAEMLSNQKGMMDDSVEIIIERLLNATKHNATKVSDGADHCLNIILSQHDAYRCLAIIVPLLVSEDEKTLVRCINCLMKLVGRLSQEQVMAQLPSFLPALFDAFSNQSPDVRKTVVFCLVDIYIMLGKAFLPHLQGLNSTQLRLVTIYASRISQARSGVALDATHG